MSDSDESTDGPVDPATDAFDPAAAFALLGDETRLRILRALWEAQRDDDTPGEHAVPFEALRERAAVDDSGRFNYHLGKLTDRFVERRDDGYRLRFAGARVVGALLEGTYAPGDELDVPAGGACRKCDGDLRLQYIDERVHVRCGDCDAHVSDFGCPPGVLAGRDADDLPGVVDTYLRTILTRAHRGICPTCSGPTRATVGSMDETPPSRTEDENDPDHPVVTVRCERCGDRVRAGVMALVLDRPAVTAFLHDRGVDPEATPLWILLDDVSADAIAVDDDPFRAVASFHVDDDVLAVTVDAEGTVVAVEETTA